MDGLTHSKQLLNLLCIVYIKCHLRDADEFVYVGRRSVVIADIICVKFESLRPSQHCFSHARTCLPAFKQSLALLRDTTIVSGEARTRNPSISSQTLYI